MVELMAQAYAAVKGWSEFARGEPVRRGFLVGFSRVKIAGRAAAGDRLRIDIRAVGSFESFTVAEGEVRRGGRLIAEGTVKVWIPDGDGEGPAGREGTPG